MQARTAPAIPSPPVYRRGVSYVVVPRDLARLHGLLVDWFAPIENVEVVLDRRERTDRRRRAGSAPEGGERRVGERRSQADGVPASATDLELPWRARRHADRIRVVVRQIPVHTRDEAVDDEVLAAAVLVGDPQAADELRLRHHAHVYACVEMLAGRRHADDLTDAVFEAATAELAMHPNRRYVEILGTWTGRVAVG